ncbi:transmembrane protein 130 [Candoia aspera]|uniref:transmembrane protein 130 n=1 Tax=Candoia aspera TaxID=51853 RepID=UPI002FD817AC
MALLFSALNFIQVLWGMLFLATRAAEGIISTDPYELEVANNGPVTTEARATIQSTLRQKNDGHPPLDIPKYHFAWKFDAPLVLVEKIKHGRNSQIVVTSPVPGAFPVSVEVMHSDCWFCGTLARNLTVLQVSEFIVGNLSLTRMKNCNGHQLDCHHTSGIPALATFSLHDPSRFFKSASFIYNWDFGDGTGAETGKPTIYHSYSTIGTRTVRLNITAEWRRAGTSGERPREVVQKTGHFTTTLKLLEEGQAEPEAQDAVRSINITGSTEAHVMENLNLSLHIQGSPPLSLCWLIKTECIPLGGDQCHLVVTNSTRFYLNHTFSNAGQYCLSVRVENRVNILQFYQEIQIRPSGIHPAFFVLPCIILLPATLGLAVYVTFRSTVQQKDLVEVADFDFSPVSTKKPSSTGWGCGQICCKTCFLQSSPELCSTPKEHHRLLQPLCKSRQLYSA